MSKRLLLSLFILANISGFCQVVTVKDRQTASPLEQVYLMDGHPGHTVITNAAGQADLSGFPDTSLISFRLTGYGTVLMRYDEIIQNGLSVQMEHSILSEEIIVAASRWQQPKEQIPGRVMTITPKEVALQNPQTAADLLGMSGEVFIQKSQQGGGSPMIRGFATNRLLYAVDGVRMNSAIFRAGNIQHVISLDPFALENTEVLFGPGSVIYGSDAIGGVMSFRTLSPALSTGEEPVVSGKVSTRYATANNEKTGHFDIHIGWKKWAALTSVSHHGFGDLRMGSNGPDDYLRPFYVQRADSTDRVIANEDSRDQAPTGYQQFNIMQKLRFRPNQQWDMQYAFHYSATSSYSRYDRLTEVTNDGLPVAAVWNYGPQKWIMNHLALTYNSPDNRFYDMFTLRLAHQYFEESRIDRRWNHHRLRTQTEQVHASSLNADFIKRAGRQEYCYGVEIIRNDVASEGSAVHILTGAPMPVASRYPASSWSSYAAYASYQLQLSSTILLQSGIRYNHFSIRSDFRKSLEFFPFAFESASIENGALTGSLGAVWQPSASWTIRGSLSTGFRAPNVDDVGKIFDFQEGEVVVPNPGLKAEYAYNAEAGLVKSFGKTLKIDITGYYTLLDNAMVRRDYRVNGQDSILYDSKMAKALAIQNAAEARVWGLHTGFELKLPYHFTLSSRFNYQLGNEEMDNGMTSRSRHAAPWFGVSRLTCSPGKLVVQLYSFYSGGVSFNHLNIEEQGKPQLYAKDENGNPYAPSWYTLNLKIMYPLSEKIRVSTGIENMTDQRYRPYSSGIAGAGRNCIIALHAAL